jgi:SecD/SecF fusion protein
MKLKGLVWFFTIVLIVVSLWELSYTWVVRSYEKTVKAKVEKQLKSQLATLSTKEEKEALVETRMLKILDSTKDKEIYPVLGTSYQKCKSNELNLGLDLQGGMSVTMDVNLQGLLKSLSNNPKDIALQTAMNKATADKLNSDENYIDLFTKAYAAQNGAGKLAALFSGANKEVKVNDNDAAVNQKLKEVAKGAINQTYRIIEKRISGFGVSQPNINLDENKGVIVVELAGKVSPERIRKSLQSSANLQFWSVKLLSDQDFQTKFFEADKALASFLKATDTTKAKDSVKAEGIFGSIVQFSIDPKNNQIVPAPYFGVINSSNASTFNEYINSPAFKNVMGDGIKFLLGAEQKGQGGNYQEVYAVETVNGLDKAPMEGDAVAEASQSYDDKGKPSIKMNMTPAGSRTWANLTEKNNGRFVAISLDDLVYSAPRVNGKIEGGNTEISGSFSIEEATDLSNVLKTGKIDAPAKIVQEQIVGATIGEDGLKGGRNAFLIAFAIIFILMLVYYNTSGWVANIALILNLLFTVGVLTALGMTLTAAGIAGLVLTIGLAVDTNVIIFERIKEELTKGKAYEAAVNEGYKRSLAPVLDAHITSFLTAAILFVFGLGPVLGFATTQMIGIALSLFCGILVSRLITDLGTSKNKHFKYFTAISSKIFKHTSYKFIEKRKIAYGISAVVLMLGLASFFNGFNKGVEFEGGRSYTVSFDRALTNNDITNDLKAAFNGENPVIKTVKDNKHFNITTSYLIGKENADAEVQTKLFEGLKKVLPAGYTYEQFVKNNIESTITVQPQISDDLKRGAVKATIFAMIVIFLYIFIRFRDWRYSLGTIVTLLHDVLVTLAVFSFAKTIVPFPLEIDQHFIAAILTVIGFSMNDTVIVFDRIREYSRDKKGASKTEVINSAINDTLSRTIMTSLTVFLTVLVLFIFGGEVTRGFAFAMMIGVITGTYSSIFVGAPILIDVAKDKPLGAAKEQVAREAAPEL